MKKIYVIHGWTYSLDKWAAIVAYLKKRDIELVLLKVPGLTQPSTKVWDIDGYVAWLDEQLKTVLEPVVIGHSNGGRIALSYAQRFPSRLKQLILVDSAGVVHNQFWPRTKLKILRVIAHVGKLIGWIPGLKKSFYKLIGARDYYKAPENMKRTMQNMLRADNSIDYAKITVPTSIIWGQNDTITPLKDGKELYRLLRLTNQLHIINNARHAPFSSHVQEVAGIVERLIGN